jgi:hypothetical protein
MASNAAIGFGFAPSCLKSEERSEEPVTYPSTNKDIIYCFTKRITRHATETGLKGFSGKVFRPFQSQRLNTTCSV